MLRSTLWRAGRRSVLDMAFYNIRYRDEMIPPTTVIVQDPCPLGLPEILSGGHIFNVFAALVLAATLEKEGI